jgi:hypothetical protein
LARASFARLDFLGNDVVVSAPQGPELGDDEVGSTFSQRWIVLALVVVVAVVVLVGVLGRSGKKHPSSAPTQSGVSQGAASQTTTAESSLVPGSITDGGSGARYFYFAMDIVNSAPTPLQLGTQITISGADQRPVVPVFVGVFSKAAEKQFSYSFDFRPGEPGRPLTVLEPGQTYALMFEIRPDCGSPTRLDPWQEGQPAITVPVINGPDAVFDLDPGVNNLSGFVTSVCKNQPTPSAHLGPPIPVGPTGS